MRAVSGAGTTTVESGRSILNRKDHESLRDLFAVPRGYQAVDRTNSLQLPPSICHVWVLSFLGRSIQADSCLGLVAFP
jgi:hypothetical protein